MGFYPRTHAVFGAMADKDIAGMLARMAPLVDRWYFTDLPLPRAATAQELARALQRAARRAAEARQPPCRPAGGAARGAGCGRPR